MEPMKFEQGWINEVRGMLFVVAQATDTPLPDSNIQAMYMRTIKNVAGDGQYSIHLISDAVEALISEWKYPSYPKPADFVKHIRLVRVSSSFAHKMQMMKIKHQLPEVASNSADDRLRIGKIIKEWEESYIGNPVGSDFAELNRRLEAR